MESTIPDNTNDTRVISTAEIIEQFGTSAPAGNRRLNSIKTKRAAVDELYCKNDAWIYGCIRTPLRLCKGMKFPDGSAEDPAISFENDSDTGFYRSADGEISMSANGTTVLVISEDEIRADSPITSTGNLVLNPDGSSIDFSGKSLINFTGITVSGDANEAAYFDSTGALNSEVYLDTVRGGTGTNSSTSTGLAKVTSGNWSYSGLVDADVDTAAAISRSKIAADTPNQIVVNDADGLVSSVAQVPAARGGTGINTSSATGVAHVSAGSWSIGLVTDNDIDPSTNIARSKLATGSANHVVVNDGSGDFSSEAQLAAVRGGTGIDTSADTGIAHVNAGVWGVSQLTDSDFGTINSLTVGELVTGSIVSTGDIEIISGGGDIYLSDSVVHQTPSNIPNGDTATYVANVTTIDDTITTLFTLPTISGTAGTAYTIRGLLSLGNEGGDTGAYTFMFKAKNIDDGVTVSSLVQQATILDGALSGTAVTADNNLTDTRVRVTGVIGMTIQWAGRFDIVSQMF